MFVVIGVAINILRMGYLFFQLLLTSIERFPKEEDLVLTCTANLFFLTREHYMIFSVHQRQLVPHLSSYFALKVRCSALQCRL